MCLRLVSGADSAASVLFCSVILFLFCALSACYVQYVAKYCCQSAHGGPRILYWQNPVLLVGWSTVLCLHDLARRPSWIWSSNTKSELLITANNCVLQLRAAAN